MLGNSHNFQEINKLSFAFETISFSYVTFIHKDINNLCENN